MKVKARMDQKKGQMTAEYHVVIDKHQFRLSLLKRVLAGVPGEKVLMVDTNQRVAAVSTDEVVEALPRAGYGVLVLPVAANPQTIFGFSYSKKNKLTEQLILVSLADGDVPDDNILSLLLAYDIAVGIEPSKTLQELGNMLCVGSPLFGSGLFKQDVYDSIVCGTVRSSFDISSYIKETTDEMGI